MSGKDKPKSDSDRLKAAFQIKCTRCGSELVSVSAQSGRMSEIGIEPPEITMECANCGATEEFTGSVYRYKPKDQT